MTLHTYHSGSLGQHDQGFALITALIFLLVVTIVGVTMYGGVTRQQHMAGNIQQKVMALSAANFAGQTALYQLEAVAIPLTENCAARSALQVQTVRVCESALADPVANKTWDVAAGTSSGVQLGNSEFNGDVAATTEHAYAAYPQYYIRRLSGSGSLQTGGIKSQNNKNFIYRITAWGVGGNAGAVAITRTLYVP